MHRQLWGSYYRVKEMITLGSVLGRGVHNLPLLAILFSVCSSSWKPISPRAYQDAWGGGNQNLGGKTNWLNSHHNAASGVP